MRTLFDQDECQNLKRALTKEWLETNGLGSYASSTIIGANTRRHHGLLVASLAPPVRRHVLLAKVEEHVAVDGHECHLSTNLYPGTVFPHGFNIQTEFSLRPWPTFRYSNRECQIDKSVFLVHGENTVVIGYHHARGTRAVELKVRPLLAFRDYNALTRCNEAVDWTVDRRPGVLAVQPYAKLPRLFFHAQPTAVDVKPDWYYKLTYPLEQERGLEFEEDLFSPFELTFRLAAGAKAYLVVTIEDKKDVAADEIVAAEQALRAKFESVGDPVRQALVRAADAFVARRGNDQLTLLAGFPWFTDWGRDAMIALPGLMLSCGRFDEARRILRMFADHCDRGLIPNHFPDAGGAPEYNTVDASLWFVVAVWRYWQASGDDAGGRELVPTLRQIIEWYQRGTRFDIRVEADGLISAGGPGTQLTWMDAKVDGYVPTPRHGKPVEINALWLNALLMTAELTEKLDGDASGAAALRNTAERVAASFVKTFWFREGGYLFDVVQGNFHDPSVRPNQIFAVSLPHSPLAEAQQESVLKVVTEHLLTPVGLRSLSPQHEKYCGHYAGNPWQRDCAYHQGTVWPWLLGAYCDAYARVRGTGKAQRKEIARLVQGLIDQLDEAGVGSVSEVFDGDPPHQPGGCMAQAWSVAELLRVYDVYLR